MFCQREVCQEIRDRGGHYFFVVKDNQPTLKESIAAEFKAAFSPDERTAAKVALDVAETVGKRSGRIERRHLQASTRLVAYCDWPGLAQVCRLVRTTKRNGVETVEIDYAITSVPRDRADAGQLVA